VKLALDHHYSPLIAERLRDAGHDVVAIVERGWEREDDESLLTICADQARALLTNNIRDFATIERHWLAEGRGHAGLVITSDASMPRVRATIGRYVTAVGALMDAHPADDGLRDRVHWVLTPTAGRPAGSRPSRPPP
jgi:hypothetical protein